MAHHRSIAILAQHGVRPRPQLQASARQYAFQIFGRVAIATALVETITIRRYIRRGLLRRER